VPQLLIHGCIPISEGSNTVPAHKVVLAVEHLVQRDIGGPFAVHIRCGLGREHLGGLILWRPVLQEGLLDHCATMSMVKHSVNDTREWWTCPGSC
jgi:hypothetical protein